VPGAGNVIDLARTDGRLAGTADVLAYQPGISAQSPGNEGAKVSIRGSGINRGPGAHASGISVSLDGLPLTGPGGTPYELLEPLWLSRAEVLRGANGFETGALALGGAINYVSRSGRDATGLELQYEAGSRGYQKRSVGYGGEAGDVNYYLAYTDTEYDGYQQHAAGDGKGAMANVGWQITPQLETRFFLRYRETNHQTPGRLTRAQIRNDPRAANPANLAIDAQRPQPGSTWLGNMTTLQIDDDSSLQAGLVYHHYPMDLNESLYRQQLDYTNLNATLDYRRQHLLFGRDSVTTLGLRVTHDLDADVRETLRYPSNGYPAGTHTRDFSHHGTNSTLHVGNDLALSDTLRLQTGLALINTRHDVQVTWPSTPERLSGSDWDYAPRLGFTWQQTPATQWFGNLSRSVEPAHPWSMIWGSNLYFAPGNGASSGRQRAPVALDNHAGTGRARRQRTGPLGTDRLLRARAARTAERGSRPGAEPVRGREQRQPDRAPWHRGRAGQHPVAGRRRSPLAAPGVYLQRLPLPPRCPLWQQPPAGPAAPLLPGRTALRSSDRVLRRGQHRVRLGDVRGLRQQLPRRQPPHLRHAGGLRCPERPLAGLGRAAQHRRPPLRRDGDSRL